MKKNIIYLVGDFETTVYDNQDKTEVWASAVCELYTEEAYVFHSIGETFEYLKSLKTNIVIYYHNLKFDGNFWLSYLLNELKMPQCLWTTDSETNNTHDYKENEVLNPKNDLTWKTKKEMPNNSFQYSISEMGQWYSIQIKTGNKMIEIRDSLKLLPFSVKKLGEDFKTKHKKSAIEYKGYRYAGCEITPEEEFYIKNDVYVVKEALEIMFDEGHDKLTIGTCCLAEFKKNFSTQNLEYNMEDFDSCGNQKDISFFFDKKNKDCSPEYKLFFPDIYEDSIDKEIYGQDNAGEYIRKSYKGGWCYLVKGKENQIKKDGTTADVNSLYPSMMHSESGNYYPVGEPNFWKGNYIPDEALRRNRYFFIRIKTKFYLKEGYLPFIQIKDSSIYRSTECLTTSMYYDKATDKYYERYRNIYTGEITDTFVTLTLTMTDYYLIKEHYELVDYEILDGCWFYAVKGIFDEYINKYKKIKIESKGAIREIAKLFLNNLYGKMASNTDSSFKVAYVKEDHSIGFSIIYENNKKPVYIPVGSAITSYARNFTIRAAQANYHGVNKKGFIYADTDSIHCDLKPEEIKGIKADPVNFCCWKLESCWDKAIFVRQKTYIEHITHENQIPIEELTDKKGNPKRPYYNVKCAGMPEKCKDLFIKSMERYEPKEGEFNEEELKVINAHYNMTDFKIGLSLYGKLRPVRIEGGVVLVDTPYVMRYV